MEQDYVVGLTEATSSSFTMTTTKEPEDLEEDSDLELGLTLGAKKVTVSNNKATTTTATATAAAWGDYCRILTAKDFPTVAASRDSSRASPLSSSSSVSSSATMVVAGTKRTADSVANTPSQMVVGWPPIRAFRMNSLVNQSRDSTSEGNTTNKKNNHGLLNNTNEGIGTKNHEKKVAASTSRFVKVNMDGDPIGRKVDLNAHLSYETLASALEIMFQKPTTAPNSPINSSTKASKLLDGSSEFALTYEDKDGDWMLVGDVPWRMFLDTVKRLRIMRTSDANGLAPRIQSSTCSRKPA